MLCDECQKRRATVHITKIHNNQKVAKHLCEQCANRTGEVSFFTFDNTLSVHDLLKGMFSFEAPDTQGKSDPACGNCGMTYQDFCRAGKIGCGQCYTTFEDLFEPVIRRMHGACDHTGKIPKRSGKIISLRSQIGKLRQELERCVSREEYEEAARVRDEIRRLEQNLT